MLVLTRRVGQSIRLELPDGRTVMIHVLEEQGRHDGRRLGIEAPQDVTIMRDELGVTLKERG